MNESMQSAVYRYQLSPSRAHYRQKEREREREREERELDESFLLPSRLLLRSLLLLLRWLAGWRLGARQLVHPRGGTDFPFLPLPYSIPPFIGELK